MSAAQYMADVFRRRGVVEPDRLAEALAAVERERGGTLLDVLSRNGLDETPLSERASVHAAPSPVVSAGSDGAPDRPRTVSYPRAGPRRAAGRRAGAAA